MRRRLRTGACLPVSGVARHLAAAASAGHTVTYSYLARECGGLARGQGRVLAALADRCAREGLPVLPVLAVTRATRLPTVRAPIYQRLGLTTRGAILAEQRRCFDHDWSPVDWARIPFEATDP